MGKKDLKTLFFLFLAMSCGAISCFGDSKKNVSEDKENVFKEEDYLSKEESCEEYYPRFLRIVRYHKKYYITNNNLQVLGSSRTFEIVEDEKERGKNNKIFDNDVISFLTVMENISLEDYETIFSAEEAYDYLVTVSNLSDYFLDSPSFTREDYYCDFFLNSDPCKIAKDYIGAYESEERYNPSSLYIVYKDGSLYLCEEKEEGQFFVIDTNPDSIPVVFTLSPYKMDEANLILSSQVSSFRSYITLFTSSDYDETITIEDAYRLLEIGLKQQIKLPFSKPFLSQFFSDSQVSMAHEIMSEGLMYLDSYHMGYSNYYNVEDVQVVISGDFTRCLLATDVKYDEKSNSYQVNPLRSFNDSQSSILIDGNILKYPLHIIPFKNLINSSLNRADADTFYRDLSESLILHHYSMSWMITKSFVANSDDMFGYEVGKELGLKLKFEQ